MTELTIRPATPNDAEAVARLCEQLGYPNNAADIGQRLATQEEGSAVLVAAASDGSLLGWIEMQVSASLVSAPSAMITGLVVADGARRKGVGRALAGAAEGWARQLGFARIGVRSNAAREGAHAFYPGIGYRLVKTQHCYAKDL